MIGQKRKGSFAMKSLLAAALVLGFAHASQADTLPSVKDVSLELNNGAAMINVTINSCAQRSLRVSTSKTSNGIVQVSIFDQSAADCRSMGIDRSYTIYIGADEPGDRYVLMNPLQPVYR
jgi:hypothetical protein